MKLNVKALAIASGSILGISIFLLTAWFVIRGYNGEILAKVGSVYLGYTVTWLGALIGLIYGFIDGLVFGALFGYIYNKIVKD
jgi:hypothetical protein